VFGALYVKDVKGKPIEDVKIDIWETDSTGHYDVQYSERDGPDGRCVMRSDKEGRVFTSRRLCRYRIQFLMMGLWGGC